MNIFVVSRDWDTCAQALDDKRLNEMILETAQILCTVINEREGSQVTPHRSCHQHHPITKWVEEDVYHLRWLYQLGRTYGDEIIYRHGRKHSCHLVLEGLTFKWPELAMVPRRLEEQEFYNSAKNKSLGLDFTHLPVRRAYRTYLSVRWPEDKRKPVWTKRGPPLWYR
jgi:hypothetical protein